VRLSDLVDELNDIASQLSNDPEIVFSIGDANSSGKQYYVHHVDEPDGEPDDEGDVEVDEICIWITEERGV
jgi:hypothetical protein